MLTPMTQLPIAMFIPIVLDGFNINYPIILTPKEYEKLMLRESMRAYFKKKSDAIDGKKEGSEDAKKDLLPRYYINSGFFSSIFGSNTIDVNQQVLWKLI
jgi:cell surface protein SprA